MRNVTLSSDKLSTATLLERHKKIVMETWARRVKDHFPAVKYQEPPALYDALPQLMDAIINALSLVGFTVDVRAEISKEHAHQRWNLGGYTLKQVLSEMRVLRETVFEILEAEGGPLSQRDRDIILDSIEKGIITTGSEFLKLQLQEKNEELVETKLAALKVESDLYESLSVIEKLEVEQKLRDLFVSTLTHDLRSPLTAAQLNLQLLARNLTHDDGVKKIIERIDRSLARADSMIETLLDANQMRSGATLSLEKTQYDLSAQISQIIKELSLTHGDRFRFTGADHEITGRFSREKMERAIENLLSNAIKYGYPQTPVIVTLAAKGERIIISVSNQGQPIAPDDQKNVFEPFFRSKSVLGSNKKGWGLGLTLVRGITEAHNGVVELVSDAGGTTFSLNLPKNGGGP